MRIISLVWPATDILRVIPISQLPKYLPPLRHEISNFIVFRKQRQQHATGILIDIYVRLNIFSQPPNLPIISIKNIQIDVRIAAYYVTNNSRVRRFSSNLDSYQN